MQTCVSHHIDYLHHCVDIHSLWSAVQQTEKLLFAHLAVLNIISQLFLWISYDLTMRRNNFIYRQGFAHV